MEDKKAAGKINSLFSNNQCNNFLSKCCSCFVRISLRRIQNNEVPLKILYPYRTFVGRIKKAQFCRNNYDATSPPASGLLAFTPFYWTRRDTISIITDTKFAEHFMRQLEIEEGTKLKLEESHHDVGCSMKYVGGGKPRKRNILLEHTLTNSNGIDWLRQRTLIVKALGKLSSDTNGRIIQKRCKECSRKIMIESILRNCEKDHMKYGNTNQTFCSRDDDSKNKVGCFVKDARMLALEVASISIGQALGGNLYGESCAEIVSTLFLPSLGSKKENYDAKKKAFQKMSFIVNKIASNNTKCGDGDHHKNDDPSLIQRLLLEEENKQASNSKKSNVGLSREEVIGNAFSALIAGTQGSAVTIACMLVQLGYRKDIQNELSSFVRNNINEGVTITQCVNETLRVHPPVGSLPRLVPRQSKKNGCAYTKMAVHFKNNGDVDDDSDIDSDSDSDSNSGNSNVGIKNNGNFNSGENNSKSSFLFDSGQIVEVDLVGCAHGKYGKPSWKWDPKREKTIDATKNDDHNIAAAKYNVNGSIGNVRKSGCPLASKPKQAMLSTLAKPFGIGQRSCPAGKISLQIIDAAFESILSEGLKWDCCHHEVNGIVSGTNYRSSNNNDHDNWLQSLKYAPTLELPNETTPKLRFYYNK